MKLDSGEAFRSNDFNNYGVFRMNKDDDENKTNPDDFNRRISPMIQISSLDNKQLGPTETQSEERSPRVKKRFAVKEIRCSDKEYQQIAMKEYKLV